ncbi:hypothetical protein V6N11_035436 [Hibiscus sabdariffa]|uniref:Uncharacterized protein n=1 Tax=Hibiscus sabdariffa TaxID=183260 RepID=A0ABR2R0R3_9ROSI
MTSVQEEVSALVVAQRWSEWLQLNDGDNEVDRGSSSVQQRSQLGFESTPVPVVPIFKTRAAVDSVLPAQCVNSSLPQTVDTVIAPTTMAPELAVSSLIAHHESLSLNDRLHEQVEMGSTRIIEPTAVAVDLVAIDAAERDIVELTAGVELIANEVESTGNETDGEVPVRGLADVECEAVIDEIDGIPQATNLGYSFQRYGAYASHPIDLGVNYGYTQEVEILDLNVVSEMEKIRDELEKKNAKRFQALKN